MYINIFWFLIALTIGFAYVYITSPPKNIVYKFPSPVNATNTIYQNKDNKCYKFESKVTECPANTSLIKEQPLFEEAFTN